MRTKLFLLFSCVMLLVRSGPVPFCMLDEVILSWFPTSTEASTLATSVSSPDSFPSGNDSPEEIARNQLDHKQWACASCKSLTPHDQLAASPFGPPLAAHHVEISISDFRARSASSTLSSATLTRILPLLI